MKKTLMFCSVLASLSLAACTVSTSNKGSGESGFGGPEAKVNGPSLEGTWASDCITNPLMRGGYRSFQLTVTGPSFTHEEKNFSDASCQRQIDSQKIQGTVKATKDLGNGVYRIEYRIPIDANVSALRDQNVIRQGDDLKVTDFFVDISGENDKIAPTIVLHKVAGTATPAKPAPPATSKPSAPADSAGPLASGLYHSDDNAKACDLSISTMTSGGRTGAVYADFQPPCSSQNIEFDCEGSECRIPGSDLMSITLLSGNSFRLNVPSARTSATYRKK